MLGAYVLICFFNTYRHWNLIRSSSNFVLYVLTKAEPTLFEPTKIIKSTGTVDARILELLISIKPRSRRVYVINIPPARGERGIKSSGEQAGTPQIA